MQPVSSQPVRRYTCVFLFCSKSAVSPRFIDFAFWGVDVNPIVTPPHDFSDHHGMAFGAFNPDCAAGIFIPNRDFAAVGTMP